MVAHCASVGLYTNLITSGIGLTQERVKALADAGLYHIQLSIQDSEAASCDRIAGYPGAFQRKMAAAKWVIEAGLPLTVNAVIHRANVARAGEMVRLSVALGARRVEIVHTQYFGWGILNRAALMPTEAQAAAAIAEVEALRETYAGVIRSSNWRWRRPNFRRVNSQCASRMRKSILCRKLPSGASAL